MSADIRHPRTDYPSDSARFSRSAKTFSMHALFFLTLALKEAYLSVRISLVSSSSRIANETDSFGFLKKVLLLKSLPFFLVLVIIKSFLFSFIID